MIRETERRLVLEKFNIYREYGYGLNSAAILAGCNHLESINPTDRECHLASFLFRLRMQNKVIFRHKL